MRNCQAVEESNSQPIVLQFAHLAVALYAHLAPHYPQIRSFSRYTWHHHSIANT